MNLTHRVTRSVFACAFALSGLVGASAVVSAQTPEAGEVVYTSELAGWDVTIAGDTWVLDEENTEVEQYEHGDGERILIDHSEGGSYIEVSLFDDSDTAQETIDIMVSDFEADADAFEVVEEGSEGDVYYALAYFTIEDTDGYYYIEVAEDVDGNIDLMQAYTSAEDFFLEDLESAREDVLIDGVSFLDDPAIGDLEEALDAAN